MTGRKGEEPLTIIVERISAVGTENFTLLTPHSPAFPHPLPSVTCSRWRPSTQTTVRARALPSRPCLGLSRNHIVFQTLLSACWCISNNECHNPSSTAQLKRYLQWPVTAELRRSYFGPGETLANSQSTSTSTLTLLSFPVASRLTHRCRELFIHTQLDEEQTGRDA